MAGPEPQAQAEPAAIAGFASAVAADLDMLASLHDREWSAAVIAAARACPIAEQLGFVPSSPAGVVAMGSLDAALGSLPETIDQRVVDEMASDYADVYLRHFHRAAPTESVWLTEDGLERQEPMFQVQDWYRRNHLRTTDWAQRPDDHIVIELRFLAKLAERAAGAPDAAAAREQLAEIARFSDAHPLLWVHLLADRLAAVGASPVYAGLARLTAAYLEDLRVALVDVAGVARPVAPVEKQRPSTKAKEKTCADPDDRPFVPGVAPSW